MCYNKAMENKKKLLLIDGSSVAYRAFLPYTIRLTVLKTEQVCIPMPFTAFTSC